MSCTYKLLTSIIFLLCTALPQADSLDELAEHQQWKTLLGYRSDGRSDIQSPSFFLSRQGSHNPSDELRETLKAFASPPQSSNADPQCRWRGRFVWLQQRLDLTAFDIQPYPCLDFEAFAQLEKTQSISLILATGYLGNPASFYGHLLVRLNGQQPLTDITVNYGARIPPDDNMLTYITKGITGAYDSSFSEHTFAHFQRQYSDEEKRDLWGYQLALSAESRELLIAHLWEMKGVTHKYYFSHRNCAFRIAELLNLVSDKPITRESRPWDAPQAIVQRLATAQHKGQALLAEITYQPSQQTMLYSKFEQLSRAENQALQTILRAEASDNYGMQYTNLSAESRVRLLDTLLNYYRVIAPHGQHQQTPGYLRALAKRYQLPASVPQYDFHSDQNPHLGHSPSYVALGFKQDTRHGNGLTFRLRPAYYDVLDAGYGHMPGSALSMLELTLAAYEHEQRIESLDFISIDNRPQRRTWLPSDTAPAWQLKAGVTQDDSDAALELSLLGGYGYSRRFAGITTTAFAQLGIQGDGLSEVYTGYQLSLQGTWHTDWRWAVDYRQQHWLDSQRQETPLALQLRYSIAADTDLRLRLDKQQTHLSLGYYW